MSRRRPDAEVARKPIAVPWWLSVAAFIAVFAMIGISINYRAASETNDEIMQNRKLSDQIQNLMDENLALQEEIHTLKTDPKAIEREAKKLGLDLRQQKVPVPAN